MAADLFDFSRLAIGGQGPFTRVWRAGRLRTEAHDSIRVMIPIPRRYTAGQKFEFEIEVPAEGSLESVARRVSLFSRLVDEQALPDEKAKSTMKPAGEKLSWLSQIYRQGEHSRSLILVPTESIQESPLSAVGTQAAQTLACLTFDESIRDGKIEKFLAEVDEAVETARASSPPSNDRGVD